MKSLMKGRVTRLLTATALIGAGLGTGAALAEGHPDAKRVLPLGGSITEIVHALGQGDRQIARDTTASFPPEVQALPDVGYVRALSPEGVLSVAPDLIIADEGAGPPEAIAVLKSAGIPYVEVPESYEPQGIADKITIVADALGIPDHGAALANQLKADLDVIQADAAAQTTKKKVMFILSLQGGRVTAGGQNSSADAIIALAGGENALTGFEGYKQVTDEAITAAAPDVILMMSRGDDAADAVANGGSGHSGANDALLAMPAIQTTPAGREGRVVVMNGLLLLGFGPRTAEAARELHQALYGAE